MDQVDPRQDPTAGCKARLGDGSVLPSLWRLVKDLGLAGRRVVELVHDDFGERMHPEVRLDFNGLVEASITS
jgi:hypothetical protein